MAVGGTADPNSVQKQVRHRAGVGDEVGNGGGTLFTEPVLVVNQQAKIVEVSNQYAVMDQNGAPLGSVVQVGQSGAMKAVRALTKIDPILSVTLEIRDNANTPVLILHRPATLWKSTVNVTRPDGAPVGSIRMENALGKIRFAFEVNGQRVGRMRAENLRAWDIQIFDEQDAQVGQISKTWQGLAKAMFTTADNYVLQIYRPLQDPLLSMVVASSLTVDTALSQHNK